MNAKNLVMTMAGVAIAAAPALSKTTIEISNPFNFERVGEIVEVPASKIISKEGGTFRVYDSKGNLVASQLTHDGNLIFPVTIGANGKLKYKVEKSDTPFLGDTICYGRFFPERDDDMTWENDHCAYRAYGPKLQSKGERAFGYDIWSKSVNYPVIEKRYYNHLRCNKSFHKDHGDGLDVYSVGPTLGGGTAALLSDAGEIIYPYCWRTYEVLDNGPLRFCVKLEYRPVTIESDKAVVETRVITLDAGEWLNKTEIRYDGLTTVRPIVEGTVVHKENPEGYVIDSEHGYVAYEDATDNPTAGNGMIYVGIVSPEAKLYNYMPLTEAQGSAIGHVAAVTDYRPGDTVTYYWGSGWSKGGVRDMSDWKEKMISKTQRLSSPMKIKVK